MATTALHCLLPSSKLLHFKNPGSSISFSKKLLFFSTNNANKLNHHFSTSPPPPPLLFTTTHCLPTTSSSDAADTESVENERPPFDLNLAVILAGFAFEAYCTPPEKVGKREMDAANTQTVFLSELFMREIYDGQLFIKLKKGFDLPAMDPWGTSDPYVVMQLDSQVVKSNVKWATKEPTWNEEFALNIKQPPVHALQVAAWDANLVTPHKRMGNASVDLENLCDGNLHEVILDLEGMGSGGKIQLEIRYKSFEKIEEEKKWWKIPLVTDFLEKNKLEPALKMIFGSETVQAREFVQFAFGQLKTINDSYLQEESFPSSDEKSGKLLELVNEEETSKKEAPAYNEPETDNNVSNTTNDIPLASEVDNDSQSDKDFWTNLGDSVNQNILQKLGLPVPEKIKWDDFDLLNSIGLQSRELAEANYVESGLATPTNDDKVDGDLEAGPVPTDIIQTSLPDMKKVTQDLLRQTDSVLGALMVVNAAVSKLNEGVTIIRKSDTKEESSDDVKMGVIDKNENQGQPNGLVLDEKKAEEMRDLFSTAESAMEAWAMLANAMGHPTFIKSEFDKICFLDNDSTDTQVAIWRDPDRYRLVIAFRGTEQTRWKDLLTDLMLVPAGLNPERVDGDFKEEIQVHSGFLNAYDSVRPRLISLLKQAIGYKPDSVEVLPKWHVYVTGHSLGGALATLLALELSCSQLAKHGAISVTMYNFGSPRVGNRRFADIYNEKVKDSWRVVNHRDIIPTVPRLMGYCHVAQPIYLASGDLTKSRENVDIDVLEDGYQLDVIGEATPDVLVSEFMKGEKELVEKILNTEINIFLSIRDGSALMQHMEDFYYVSLLESVKSNYQTSGGSQPGEQKKLSI